MWDTNLPYIGAIPDSWKLALLGRFASEVQALNTDCAESNAFQFKMGSIISKTGGDSKYHPETLEGYNVVIPGDIVINGLNLNYDLKSLRVGQVQEKGVITAAYISIRPRGINSGFLKYLLKGFDYIKTFHGMGKGIRLTLSYGELKKMFIPVPPVEEQQRIADFLDAKCAEIDSILESTRASIEEYKKLKQSVITEAVTKGICGNRPMKDSGVEWIGEIPAEWRISRVGLHFSIILGKMLCSEQLDESYSLEKYFCAADVHFSGVSYDGLKTMWFSPTEKTLYKVFNGDLLVVEGGAGAGGAAVASEVTEDIYIQNSIMIVRPLAHNSGAYLKYLLESLVGRGYVDYACNKATIPHFTKDKLGQVPFPLPSTVEQQEIAAYLDEKCTSIDSLIASKEALITELEAYKKSIIYEYVTGKKEIPDV